MASTKNKQLFSKIILAYGVMGFIIFLGLTIYIPTMDIGSSTSLKFSVEKEFNAMSDTMVDASIASANAAQSIRKAQETLVVVADSESSIKTALENTGKTLSFGAGTSTGLADGFSSINQKTQLLGITQFGDVSNSFKGLSGNLESASGDINGLSDQVSIVTKEIRETSKYLKQNADDMDKLSVDFKTMGSQLEDVSKSFSTDIPGIPNIRPYLILLMFYLSSIHLAMAVIGYSNLI